MDFEYVRAFISRLMPDYGVVHKTFFALALSTKAAMGQPFGPKTKLH